MLSEAIINGDAEKAKMITREAIDAGDSADDIISNGLIAGMSVVGAAFKRGDIFVPEMLVSADAMHAALDVLKPLLMKSGRKFAGKVLIGTVRGDLHDIGKNLVAMMLEGAGFEVIDMGIDVSPEKFTEEVKRLHPDVLAMSALLTTTMPEMKGVIEMLKSEGLKDKVKVVVGGAPITQDYADEVGADGYAKDASSAVDKVRELVEAKRKNNN